MITLINKIASLFSPTAASIDLQCAEIDCSVVDCNYDNDYYGDRHCRSNCQ